MKGAIYLKGVGYLKMVNSEFTGNDAGPIFDNSQNNGLSDMS